MSVICRVLGNSHMSVFTKGAPEKLASLCKNDTLPSDFSNRLTEFTSQGYRVIALAYKEMTRKFRWKDAQKIKRDLVATPEPKWPGFHPQFLGGS